ncbi:MAG: rod shape-determining protein MreC [Candidatus Levyibacteriota bacterium]
MKGTRTIFSVFFICIILSLVILLFFQNPLTGALQSIILPLQRWTFTSVTQPVPTQLPSQQQLQQENNVLRTQLAHMQEIENDNKALHDQFRITTPAPKSLVPANIIGMNDDMMLLDKGSADNMKQNAIVVFKENLIGKITQTTPHISVVTLITNPAISFTAKTTKTNAIGVIKPQGGNSTVLDNVVLSAKLAKNDVIVTKGDLDNKGDGYPPNLIVGKIISINKKASNLFQSAKVESLVNFSNLHIVFVMEK